MQKTKKRGVWALMHPVMGRIHRVMALAGLSTILNISAVLSIAMAVKAVFGGHSPWSWMSLAAVLTLGSVMIRVWAGNMAHHAAFRLENILRTGLALHLAKISLGYIITAGSGSLAKVIQDDVKNLHAFVADSTPFLGRSLASPVLTFGVLLLLDPGLALGALGVLALGILVSRAAMKNRDSLQNRYDRENERINNRVVEFIQAMPVVRTFDSGAASFTRYQTALDRFLDFFIQWLEFRKVSARMGLLLLGPLPTLLVLGILGFHWIENGALNVVNWAAALLVGTGLAESVCPLMWLYHFIHKANGSAKRIQDLMDVPAQKVPASPLTPRGGQVEFRDVTFSYGPEKRPAIHRMSFCAPRGEITALVGPSGSGKTTVARLIPRFWDVDSGSVAIGGVDVREIALEVLASQISLVFQDTFLFNDTIANNISLGVDRVGRTEMEAAARAAQAHDFIKELPKGYDTLAGDRGTRLSGGQRQQITIARAILQNRPIVILDEATAFADPENEARLVKALANLMQGKTTLIIAHRLATIQDADQILVLDRGKIAEKGRHHDLMAQNGLYARLWRHHEAARNWTLDRNSLPFKEAVHE